MQRWEERRMLERLKTGNKKASVLSCKRTNISHSCLQRGGGLPTSPQDCGLGEGLCLQWLLYESCTLGFFCGEGERSQLCVERQQVSAVAWAVGDMKALTSPHRWYWRFGWNENLDLKKSHVLCDT